jgi:hypothetical protein
VRDQGQPQQVCVDLHWGLTPRYLGSRGSFAPSVCNAAPHPPVPGQPSVQRRWPPLRAPCCRCGTPGSDPDVPIRANTLRRESCAEAARRVVSFLS